MSPAGRTTKTAITAKTAKTASTSVHVALLRGINVGGKNILPMRDLVALFVAAGCDDVKTLIQSGNVVCAASPALAKHLPALIETAILKRFGCRVPVVLRTAQELRDVAAANPFLQAAPDTDPLHVGFLADAPSADRVATLDPHRSPPDEFHVRRREVYFRFPNGVARTRFTNLYFDSKLATTITVRNWRTVMALVAMTSR